MLQSLPTDFSFRCGKLVKLDLLGNNFSKILPQSFVGLTAVTEIGFQFLKLESLNVD